MADLQLNAKSASLRGSPKASGSDYVNNLTARSEIKIRVESANFIRKAFGFSLFTTTTAIFFQGFGVWGFHLNDGLLNWLGAATFGQVAGIFAMVLRHNPKSRLES